MYTCVLLSYQLDGSSIDSSAKHSSEGVLVQYDLASLFTNIPFKYAMAIAVDLSCLNKNIFKELLFLWSHDTLQTFEDKTYL